MANAQQITPWDQIAGDAPLARIPIAAAAQDAAPPVVSQMQDASAPPVLPAPIPRVALGTPSPQEQQIKHDQTKLQKIQFQQENPWGTENNHPGVGGKIAHVLSVAGNIAGDIFAPSTMALIPGTALNRQVQEGGLAKRLNSEIGDESENQSRDALTAHTQAETDDLQHPKPHYTPLATTTGDVNYDPSSGTATPLLGSDGKPLSPVEKNAEPKYQMTDHGLFRIAPNGEATPITYNGQPLSGPTKTATEQPKPVMANGRSTFAIETQNGWVDAQTHQPIPGSVTPIPPPPNYGQLILPTKTATFIDPQTGLPTENQWNPKTQKYDIPMGLSASNAYGHEAAQAGAVERAGENVIADLQANRAKLGTLGAWVAKKGLNTPIADPTLQGIQAELASFAALNPAMHGARGTEAMKHFEDLIGGLQQNPDATIAGIRAIIHTAAAVNPGLNAARLQSGQPSNNPHGPKVGEVDNGFRYKGGDPAQQSSWEKVK